MSDTVIGNLINIIEKYRINKNHKFSTFVLHSNYVFIFKKEKMHGVREELFTIKMYLLPF
jgi:hypothetical protein